MKRMPLAATALLAVLFLPTLAFGATAATPAPTANDPAAVKIVQRWEAKLNLDGIDLTTQFTLVQKKDGEADRILRVTTWRRDAADTYTILFAYPDSEKGKGYLRKGDDLYFYLPSTREFVYRNRKDNIGSTDARTDLFGRQDTLAQYWVALAGTATVNKWDCDVVRLDAKTQDVTYPIQKWYVRRSDGLPVKVENFSASETLLATSYYIDYKDLGTGKFLFTKLLAVNNLETGQKTYLTNDNISTAAIPEYTFTKAFLEEQSR